MFNHVSDSGCQIKQGITNFRKYTSHAQILGARRLTQDKFRGEHLKFCSDQ